MTASHSVPVANRRSRTGTLVRARVLLHLMVRFLVPLVSVPLLLGCGAKLDPSQHPTPESLYEASMRAFRAGRWGLARQGFQRLTFELAPRDDRSAEVRYYLAECMLQQREELEAARQFRRVADEYPRHRLAPDALLRAGDAYRRLWNDPELDPAYGETALATYTELLGRYPPSPAAARARIRVGQLNERFAAKDFKNGDFYLRFRAYDSAIIYFKDIILKYPRTSYAPKAVIGLVKAYDRIGYDEEKREMCLHLEQYYPGTEGVEERCQG